MIKTMAAALVLMLATGLTKPAVAGILSDSAGKAGTENAGSALPEQAATADIQNPGGQQPTYVAEEKPSFHQVLKEKFIEGGAGWMAPILLCLILGLGLAIERILYLHFSSVNNEKLLNAVDGYLSKGDIEGAKEHCRNTRGPVASLFYQGLDRLDEGAETVEKSIISYGSVLTGRLESNLTWLSLFISLSPMLGFLGTVVGMVVAFDAIEAAGDISPAIVAGGIKVALLTTVFGLIVAMILQVLYNYIVSRIDSIINAMEDATISFMDIVLKKAHNHKA